MRENANLLAMNKRITELENNAASSGQVHQEQIDMVLERIGHLENDVEELRERLLPGFYRPEQVPTEHLEHKMSCEIHSVGKCDCGGYGTAPTYIVPKELVDRIKALEEKLATNWHLLGTLCDGNAEKPPTCGDCDWYSEEEKHCVIPDGECAFKSKETRFAPPYKPGELNTDKPTVPWPPTCGDCNLWEDCVEGWKNGKADMTCFQAKSAKG